MSEPKPIMCNTDANTFDCEDFSKALPGKTLVVSKADNVTITFKRSGSTATSVTVSIKNAAGELTDVLFGVKTFIVDSSTDGHPMPISSSAPEGDYTIEGTLPGRGGPREGMNGTIRVSTGH